MRYYSGPILAILFVLWQTPASHCQTPDEFESRIDKGIKFLANMQDRDGSWRLSSNGSPAATSLAIMAFLSCGHVPGEGPYGEQIEKGIAWVVDNQQQNGLFAKFGYEMYEHGITTLMLAEVCGMTNSKVSKKLRPALEKGVKLILQAQNTSGQYKGGWRYQINSRDADVSVTGWQLLALKAAKNVGCDVPAERIEIAMDFLKRCRDPQSGGYCYQPSAGLTVPCTGTAILCLELCDQHHSKENLRAGGYLLRNPPKWGGLHFFYNVYYGSQATFQLGGNYWKAYRPVLHKVLFDNQARNGSWSANNGFGPVYSTAMCILAMTVEYRYLPIYQRGNDSELPKGE